MEIYSVTLGNQRPWEGTDGKYWLAGIEGSVRCDLRRPRRPEVVRFVRGAWAQGHGRVPRAARHKAAVFDGGCRGARRVRRGSFDRGRVSHAACGCGPDPD